MPTCIHPAPHPAGAHRHAVCQGRRWGGPAEQGRLCGGGGQLRLRAGRRWRRDKLVGEWWGEMWVDGMRGRKGRGWKWRCDWMGAGEAGLGVMGSRQARRQAALTGKRSAPAPPLLLHSCPRIKCWPGVKTLRSGTPCAATSPTCKQWQLASTCRWEPTRRGLRLWRARPYTAAESPQGSRPSEAGGQMRGRGTCSGCR